LVPVPSTLHNHGFNHPPLPLPSSRCLSPSPHMPPTPCPFCTFVHLPIPPHSPPLSLTVPADALFQNRSCGSLSFSELSSPSLVVLNLLPCWGPPMFHPGQPSIPFPLSVLTPFFFFLRSHSYDSVRPSPIFYSHPQVRPLPSLT